MADRIRVLLVDDDADVADLTATYLERVSDRITAVRKATPGEGLAALDAERIDCIVSDYDMPETNGLEFLESVRAVESNLPFILFTGKGSEEIASEAISAGVTDYLQKVGGSEQYEMLANRIENAVAQHRAEAEAIEANRQMLRMFQRITDAFFAIDNDWKVTYINQRAAEFLGYSQDDLIGEDLRELFPKKGGERLYDAYQRAFEKQEPVTLEAKSVFRPGKWVEERVYPAEDGLSVYFQDITERKEMEAEIREAKGKIEDLHDIAARVVTCTSDEEIYDLAIEAAKEILEFDICAADAIEDGLLVPKAVSTKSPTDGYYEGTPLDADENLAAETARNQTSRLVTDLHEAGYAPAEATYQSAVSIPIGDVGVFQAVSKEVGGFDEDDLELAELLVTHITQALKRIQFEEELRAEIDRFAALFDNVPNATVSYVFDEGEPVVRDVNPAFEDAFGWDVESIVDRPMDDFLVPSGKENEARRINERVKEGIRIEGEEIGRQTEDGVRDFLLHTAPVQVGDSSEGFTIYTDITVQKQRERKLERQNERLDEFASVISHDLRNPLNVATGRLDLLQAEYDSHHIPPIQRALDRMEALIEDVLALAQQGKVVSETGAVSLTRVVKHAWAMVSTETAELYLDDSLAVVDADEGRLCELLENLFRNAIEHAGSDATVTVGPLEDEDGFFVADDGPGIPSDDHATVFEHGYSTTDGGTGFGLAIVRSITEAHGWEIRSVETGEDCARFEILT
ncbi:PAS domain S-box-containing protein [Haladaptatus litoreus]|uniref:histidine kinase n=1 Tax=Haladaptatus litoreus TaxID=553468 RepID=A0A1N7B5T9_9EURY|nr:PAS domain S-box protein [Haladaptatus litoreus]SIR46664.1 PAS domain S-box-containing protein [Haladaptatus litoreus]